MKKLSLIFAAVATVAAMIFTAGCETDSADEISVSISPNYAKLKAGQSITLTASGGWNYRWSVRPSTAGSLSRTAGDSVVYTAVEEGKTVTIELRGMGGETTSSTSTNAVTTTGAYTATATIVQ